MPISRYANDKTIKGGTTLATNESIQRIRNAFKQNLILCDERPLVDGERLDMIAYQVFGDGGLWWVIAALSNIGWWLQASPGTLVRVPVQPQQVLKYL